jgi:hypothetical protein
LLGEPSNVQRGGDLPITRTCKVAHASVAATKRQGIDPPGGHRIASVSCNSYF